MKHHIDNTIQGVIAAGISGVSTIAQVPLQEISEGGNLVSILISIFSGIVALYKLLKKNKSNP